MIGGEGEDVGLTQTQPLRSISRPGHTIKDLPGADTPASEAFIKGMIWSLKASLHKEFFSILFNTQESLREQDTRILHVETKLKDMVKGTQ